MIKVTEIDAAHKADINLPNEPFALFGRMIPSYTGETWSFEVERFPREKIGEMCFPDENYNYETLSQNSVFVGAYDGETCVGLAILQREIFKYFYLYDLKVSAAYRGRGIGGQLIAKSIEIALAQGYRGLYTIGQDNNLGACLFYLKHGFVIGGLDTHVYTGTSQEGKKDILFYLDAATFGEGTDNNNGKTLS